MGVVRQDFRDAFLAHGLHRNAIGQAVALVRTGFVKSKAGKECLVRLRMNGNGRISMKIADKRNRFLPENVRQSLARSMTTQGITRLSWIAILVLVVLGAVLLGILARRPAPVHG